MKKVYVFHVMSKDGVDHPIYGKKFLFNLDNFKQDKRGMWRIDDCYGTEYKYGIDVAPFTGIDLAVIDNKPCWILDNDA